MKINSNYNAGNTKLGHLAAREELMEKYPYKSNVGSNNCTFLYGTGKG